MRARSRARGWALQTLYAWEMRGGEPARMIAILEDLAANLRVSPQNRLFAEVLVRLAVEHLGEVDALLEDRLANWRLDRLATIDRNILRLGVLELRFVDDVPRWITIREMMKLAEKYGTPESPRFVNGVLDAVARRLAAGGVETSPR